MKKVFLFSGVKKFLPVILTVLTVLSLVTLTGCSKKITIDFKECTFVTFSGYNGEGAAYINFDNDYALSLVGDKNMMTVMSVLSTVSANPPENSGSLSNGDKVKVKITYDSDKFKNAGLVAKNTELEFTVEGLEEKPILDVFANVTLEVRGTSPECSVSVNYTGEGLSTYSLEIVDGDSSKRYKNGDKVTVKIKDSELENLRNRYAIEETSREYVVKADSAYILSPDDLDAAGLAKLNETVQDNLDTQIQKILNNDRSTGSAIIAKLTGYNPISVASSSAKVTSVENVKLNSSYVGTAIEKGAFGNTIEHRYVYFFYDADLTHNYKSEETIHCTLLLRFSDTAVTSDGISFSEVAVGARKNFQAAYDELISSDFKKLS